MSYLKKDSNETTRRATWAEITPQGRAGRATFLLMRYGRMTTEELMQALGYKQKASVELLMDNLSIGEVPIFHHESDDYWEILGDMRYVFD